MYASSRRSAASASRARSSARSPRRTTTRRTTSAASRPTSCSSSSSRRAATPGSGCSRSRRATTRSRTTRTSRRRSSAPSRSTPPGGPWSRTQARPGERRGDDARRSRRRCARTRSRSTRKAQKDKTSRAEFEGAGGPLRRVPLEVRDRARRPTRSSSTSARSTSSGSSGTSTPRRTTWPRPRASRKRRPRRDARRRCATTRSTTRSRRSSACARRARGAQAREGQRRDRGRQEVRRGARPLRAVLSERPAAAGACSSARASYYFDNGNYDSAVKIWGTLLEKFPNSEQARDAGEQHPRVVQPGEELREHRDVGAPAQGAARASRAAKQQEKLDALIVQAVFKQGEQKAAAGDHAAAAAAYLRAAKEFPQRPARGAGVRERRAGGQARGRREDAAGGARSSRWARTYRDQPESPQGAWIATTTLQAMGLFGEAADIARADGEPRRPRAPELRQVRAREGRRLQRRRPARGHGRARSRRADGNKFLAHLRIERRGRRGRLPDGPRPPERGPRQGRRGALRRYITRAKNLDHRARAACCSRRPQREDGRRARGADASRSTRP